MEFKNYTDADYSAVCDFLIELNRDDKSHINWNWARFEWMYEHPEFDKSAKSSIGLWKEGGKVVGAAIYDMYFGEAFCAALPEHQDLYPEILDYAFKELSDEGGLGIAVCDESKGELEAAEKAGFAPAEQTETIMSISLELPFDSKLPEGYELAELDQEKDIYALMWLFRQGFDHGSDRAEFEKSEDLTPHPRVHFNKSLSLAAVPVGGEPAAYCSLWYSEKTDYAYVEPVCTLPSCRGKGLAKALIYEALNRAAALGAKKAYVISDMDFYKKLGFEKDKHYTFYWRKHK